MDFCWDDKRVLITGGTGSWGQEVTRQLLQTTSVKEIRIYSRGEYHQVEMRRTFQHDPRLKFIIGDVRDKDRLCTATRHVDGIIHLAALKHVPVVEEHLWEALQTNTLGSQHVIEAAQVNNVSRVLFVSSDKAVEPLNFYGITKLAAERLMIAANQDDGATQFITYRAGNVMGSAGSVIPVFQTQLVHENMITLTDPSMTRFFASKREIVRKALQAFLSGIGGETFIPKMQAATLGLVAEIMMKHLGHGDTRVHRIAVRPGEKYTELMISRYEAERTRELEEMWVVLPLFPSTALAECYQGLPIVTFRECSSENAPQFSTAELEALLREEGFLSTDIPSPHAPLYFQKGTAVFH